MIILPCLAHVCTLLWWNHMKSLKSPQVTSTCLSLTAQLSEIDFCPAIWVHLRSMRQTHRRILTDQSWFISRSWTNHTANEALTSEDSSLRVRTVHLNHLGSCLPAPNLENSNTKRFCPLGRFTKLLRSMHFLVLVHYVKNFPRSLLSLAHKITGLLVHFARQWFAAIHVWPKPCRFLQQMTLKQHETRSHSRSVPLYFLKQESIKNQHRNGIKHAGVRG